MIERLTAVAKLWSARSDRSLSRLATIVVNDGKLFDRISAGGGCTVATLEKLVAHLRDERNWPSMIIPDEAHALLADFPTSGVVACSACDMRAEAPQVASCTRTDCPMRAREEQKAAA